MMMLRFAGLSGIVVAAALSVAPAHALTMKECSAKYSAAKQDGTLAGATWNEFRKAQCGAGDAATAPGKAPTTADAASGKQGVGLTTKECSAKYQAAKGGGTLNGLSWNEFRKAQCAADATAKGTKETAATGKKPTIKVVAAAGLSIQECSARYQAAKKDQTLGSMKWNDFRKAKCGTAAADDDTVPASDEAQYNGEPASPTIKAPGGVTLPRVIAGKYASESPGKGRLHTCLDQYYADKDSNALGGLKWIQKGGGFYSLCNARLKG